MPLPRSRRINSVSAWSSRVCAVRIWVAPLAGAALRQQAVTRLARRGRQSGFRLGAGPAQRPMRQIEAAREPLDLARLAAASARKP